MAVYTYSTTNISWSSTDNWANEVDGNSNITVSGSSASWGDDLFPATGATNIKISEQLYNNKIFYGTMYTKTNVSAQVTLPYTGASIGQSSNQVIKNCSYNDNATVRLVASPTYPYVFQKWTSDSGGSTTLSTSATLNLGSTDHTGVTTFYAWATSPSTETATLRYDASSRSNACSAAADTTVYWHEDDGSNFWEAYKLYTNATLTTEVNNGFYSNGSVSVSVTSGVVSAAEPC